MNESMDMGCGLIRIGRTWGAVSKPVPNADEAQAFLRSAHEQGVTVFDTAPSYGSSEERLGAFLATLSADQRSRMTVLTKCGEQFDVASGRSTVDHSYDALRRSIDTSIERLGTIDVLQIHKASPEVLRSSDLGRAMEYAQERGIGAFGASISDNATGEMAASDERFSYLQLPFNLQNETLRPTMDAIKTYGKNAIVNRPLNMGALAQNEGMTAMEQTVNALLFILQERCRGIILTGTASPTHLRENLAAFREASQHA